MCAKLVGAGPTDMRQAGRWRGRTNPGKAPERAASRRDVDGWASIARGGRGICLGLRLARTERDGVWMRWCGPRGVGSDAQPGTGDRCSRGGGRAAPACAWLPVTSARPRPGLLFA
jgi:hypothetical protein